MTSISALIVGTGSIARKYATIIDSLNFESYFVSRSDRNLQGSKRFLPNYRAFQRPSKFEVLIIASATSLHIQDAIEFGKFADAILIEKPVTHRLLSEKELGVLSIYESKIAVSYPLRFAPAFNSVNAALKKVNEFERVTVTAKSDSRKWRKEDVNPNGYWLSAEEGGVLREFSHEIDYAISFFGQPQRILDRRISTSKLGPDSLPGEIVLDYRSEKCKKVSLDLSMDSEREVRYLQAFWNGGFLNWNILTGHVSLKNDNELVHFNHGSFNQLNSLKIQLLSLLRQKDMPSLCTFSQGIEIVKTIDLFSKEFDLIYDGRI